MESFGRSLLQRNLEEFKASNVDPAQLAWEVRLEGAITDADWERATDKKKHASQRWDDLVLAIMKRSNEGSFQKFVDVLLGIGQLEELGRKMKDTYLQSGRTWTTKPQQATEFSRKSFGPCSGTEMMIGEENLLSSFWIDLFQRELGIKSEGAMKYVGCESYLHLVQFARTPKDKKDLKTLLNMESEEYSFKTKHESQKKNLEMRLNDAEHIIQELSRLQMKGKDVEWARNSICETLHVPTLFWPPKTTKLEIIVDQLKAFQKQFSIAMRTEELNDASHVIKGSGGCALQGILLTRSIHDQLHKRQELIKPPQNICFMLPLHPQHVITKQFGSKHQEEVFTNTMKNLGYTFTDLPMVDFIGSPFKILSTSNHTTKEGQNCKQEAYCSTVQYFVIPLASCWFSDDQFQFSDDAIKDLKTIERLSNSLSKAVNDVDNEFFQRYKELQGMCKKFFKRFGSHANKGPLHFGGTYQWAFHSSGFKLSDIQAVQELQSESIMNFAGNPVFESVTEDPYTVMYDGKDSSTCVEHSLCTVATSGGPQGVIGLPGWKNGLIASNRTWCLIDRGTTLVPVWDIIRNNHKSEFKKPYSLAALMNQAWKQMNQYYSEQEKQDPVGNIAKVTQTVMSWNSSPDMSQSKEWLHNLVRVKQDVARMTMSPQVWPTLYISQPEVQKLIKSIVDYYIQQSTAGGRLPEAIKVAIKEVVEPLDLNAVRNFSNRKHISRWVYSTETFPIPMDCENMLSLHKYFQYALDHTCGQSKKEDALVATQPHISPSITIALAKAVHCFTNHLKNTGQEYEENFILTMLQPFDYDPDQCEFLTTLSLCDLKYLCNKYDHHCRKFFEVMKQRSVQKSQAYLFLLALDMRDELHTSNSQMRSYLQSIEQRIGNDIDSEVAEILHHVHSCNNEWEWLQSLLESVSFHDVTGKSSSGIPTIKQQCEKVFSVLGLMAFYPQKLTLQHALHIREDTLVSVRHLQDTESSATRKKAQKPASHANPKHYPFLILQKIMAFDIACRTKLVLTSESHNDSIKILSVGKGVGKEDTEVEVHPMDGFLGLLHCADNFLRQDLMLRLTTCQLAIPLLLPDPFLPQKVTLLIWALRSIVREWHSNGTPKESQLVTYPSPIVSFLRIGKLKVSKSHTMNTVISESGHDVFFHYNCSGGKARQFLMKGLVEVCWYLPSNKDMLFSDLVAFANLHGDAREFPKQVNFLSKVSFMNFVFISEDNLNYTALKMLRSLATVPGGLVLLQVGSSKMDSLEHNWQTVNLEYKNEAEISEEIRESIKSKLCVERDGVTKHSSLEDLSDAAHKCDILVDEDEEHCLRSKELATTLKQIVFEFRQTQSAGSPQIFLPLQGFWQEWALTEKEQYRQTQRGEYNVHAYSQQQRSKMEDTRKVQLDHVKCLNFFIESFLTSLLTYEGKTRHYLLRWMQLFLDSYTREHLPQLHNQYKEKVLELQAIQSERNHEGEKACKTEIEKITKQLIEASFGFEHLMREVGQIYEAVAAQVEVPPGVTHILRLPAVAAELMIEGYPLELMDGDAAHVPITWVSAVLSKVQEFLDNPRVFVLSVLGVQSSGKSTLLNTVFGVRFTTSAGRCTRGAFMQLLPIHKNLRQECRCDYFLVVDTEGLRAPELDAIQTHEHDNELATFVIGLANQTIINLSGETIGDMGEILQTAVHAFLRMKEKKLKPNCQFVHQNVTAVKAREKMSTGQVSFKVKLDEMTRTAATEEGVEDEYKLFTNVIDFDGEKDVFHFQNLWQGTPPMAPINPGYSNNAQFLKLCLINYAKQSHLEHFDSFEKHFKILWKAILHENFVFGFKSTLDVVAYNALNIEYGKCSWEFKQKMMTWEHRAYEEIKCCEMSMLTTVYQKCCHELAKYVLDSCEEEKRRMDTFFQGSNQREIIIKWKGEMTIRLDLLMRQLKGQAEQNCKLWKARREVFNRVDNMKVSHCRMVLEHARHLVSKHNKQKMEDKQLEKMFNEKCVEWIKESNFFAVHMEAVSVQNDVEKCLTDFEILRPSLHMVLKKLHSNPLEKRSIGLQLHVERRHMKARYVRSSEFPVTDGQYITDKLLNHQKEYLQQMKQRHHNPNFVTELLFKLFEDISSHTDALTAVAFTEEYKVDMALTVCGYALSIFQKMLHMERIKEDLEKCLTGFELLRPSLPMILEKLHSRPLEQRGFDLRLEIKRIHVNGRQKHKGLFSLPPPLRKAQEITDKVLGYQWEYLEQVKHECYSPNLASDLLRKLFEDICNQKTAVTFTEEYKVDIALTVCGVALLKFQEMAQMKKIEEEVEKCLTEFELLRPFLPTVMEKLRTKPLDKRGNLQLEVEKGHVKERMCHVLSSEFPTRDAQNITNKLLECQKNYLQQLKQKLYNPNLTTDLLHNLFGGISDVNFTKEYRVDIAITVCRYAVTVFQEMVDTEKKENDPVEYFEKEMKGHLLKTFIQEYNQIVR